MLNRIAHSKPFSWIFGRGEPSVSTPSSATGSAGTKSSRSSGEKSSAEKAVKDRHSVHDDMNSDHRATPGAHAKSTCLQASPAPSYGIDILDSARHNVSSMADGVAVVRTRASANDTPPLTPTPRSLHSTSPLGQGRPSTSLDLPDETWMGGVVSSSTETLREPLHEVVLSPAVSELTEASGSTPDDIALSPPGVPYLSDDMVEALVSPALPKACKPLISQEAVLTPTGMQITYVVVDSGHPHSLGRKGYQSWETDAALDWQAVKPAGKWERTFLDAVRTSDDKALLQSVLALKHSKRRHPDRAHAKLRNILAEVLLDQPSRYFRWTSSTLRSVFFNDDLTSLPPHLLTTLFLQRNEAKFTAALEHAWYCSGKDQGANIADHFLEVVDRLQRPHGPSESRPPALLPQWRHAVEHYISTSEEAAELWYTLITVPPSVMLHCDPLGAKENTCAAARTARAITHLAESASVSLKMLHLDQYARLACQHDSGHTINTMLKGCEEMHSHDNIVTLSNYSTHFRAIKIPRLMLSWNAPEPLKQLIIGPSPFSNGRWDYDIPDVYSQHVRERLKSLVDGH